jgi:hypothetical protein
MRFHSVAGLPAATPDSADLTSTAADRAAMMRMPEPKSNNRSTPTAAATRSR